MNALLQRLNITTTKAPELIDITNQVEEAVAASQIRDGIAVVYSKHTTAAIKINENEPLLLQDMAHFLEKCAPRNGNYLHNDFTIRKNMPDDECPNGHSHCRQLVLGTSESVPLIPVSYTHLTLPTILLV